MVSKISGLPSGRSLDLGPLLTRLAFARSWQSTSRLGPVRSRVRAGRAWRFGGAALVQRYSGGDSLAGIRPAGGSPGHPGSEVRASMTACAGPRPGSSREKAPPTNGIGAGLSRIVRALRMDERALLTVSSLAGEAGNPDDVSVSLPRIVGAVALWPRSCPVMSTRNWKPSAER